MTRSIDPAVDEAADRAFESLAVGEQATRTYRVTEAIHRAFLAAFDDRSPVHVDEAYARAAGFGARVMHGAILNGFVSHLVGMVLPGRRALLQSVDLRYLLPVFLDDELTLRAEVTQAVESQRVVVLSLLFERAGQPVARGRAQVGVRAA